MSLSNDLLSQFVKIAKDDAKPKTETTVYGTTVEYNGRTYVRLDGSDLLTPVESTVATVPGERVTVMIKDHTATVTGNLSSPSARKDDVDALGSQITEFEIVVADKVNTKELDAEKARIDELVAEDALIRGELTAGTARIDELVAKDAEITGKLTANEAEIADLKTGKLDAEIADIKYATVENLNATNADIHNLNATFGAFKDLTTEDLAAVRATIDSLDSEYANIDFANIGEAALRKIFADSGLIKDIIVGTGTITGELVGVTIKGDLIEGNTIKADKLVVKGSDGLYYKLNFESGKFTDAEEVPTDGLHGSVIIAKSITADRIAVTDLVAFGATIGGFKIGSNSLYSGVKEFIDNTTEGVYLDSTGQVAFGDETSFLKLYKDSENAWRLAIAADRLLFGSTKKSVEDVDSAATNAQSSADEAQSTANNASERTLANESTIQQMADMIASLVTDGNGTSLMTQTSNGWAFNIGDIVDQLSKATNDVNTLNSGMTGVNTTLDSLKQAVNDLGVLADYVIITTYNDQPCIELGEAENNFKLRITNTEIQFADGTVIPAYLSNQKLNIEKAEIKDELQFGGFVWKKRSNGNMGLIWKGVDG